MIYQVVSLSIVLILCILSIFFYIKFKKERESRKAIELKLREFMDVANKSSSIKSVFLANISHEIKTPLNAVLGFLELSLEDKGLTEKLHKYLIVAWNSAKDLLRIINEVLDGSKLEAGKVEVIKEHFYLPRLIESIYETFKPITDEKGLKLDFNLPTNLHKCIVSDPYKLKQILINTIDNAIKFTEKGIVKLKIIEEPYFIKFIIKDSGIGIPDNEIEHIFDEFIQVDHSYTKLYGGIGLGSSISRHYINLLGGGVKLSSKLGKGSKFSFTIPKELSKCDEATCIDCYTKEYESGSFNILLGERFRGNAELIKIRLEEKGHKVTVASNGFEVLEKIKNEHFDILLLDVHLPVLNGIETIKEIRSSEFKGQKGIPVIGLTASVIDNVRLDCVNAGINQVLSKPIDFDELFKAINILLSKESNLKASWPKLENIKGIDIEKGITNWQNERQYFEALKDFSAKHSHIAELIENTSSNKNSNELKQIAHTMKGICGNLAITGLEKIMMDLELLINSGDNVDEGEILSRVKSEMEIVVNSISKLVEVKGENNGKKT